MIVSQSEPKTPLSYVPNIKEIELEQSAKIVAS
jgi:hypothetical protein